MRVECLIVKEEFYNQVYLVDKTFDSVLNACQVVYENKKLPQFLLLICKAGNFLNHVNFLIINYMTLKQFFS